MSSNRMTVNVNVNKRQGNKWTVSELISLQREYELLELTVQQIAEKHQRSESSIMYKLDSEGLIDNWNDARGFNSDDFKKNVDFVNKEDDCDDNIQDDEVVVEDDDEEYNFVEENESDDDDISDDESDVEKLAERVWSLETSVSEISSMVKNIYSILSAKQSSKPSKRKHLRNLNATI